MKRITLLAVLVLCACYSYAQLNQYPRLTQLRDSVNRYIRDQDSTLSADTADERYFSSEAYDRFFDKYFTQMQYSRDNFTEGNSASLKVDDKTSVLNLTLSRKMKGSIFSLGTAVPVTDKSGVIFSGDKPSTGTELFTSFAIILSPQRNLTFRGDRMFTNWDKRRFLLDSLRFVYSEKNIRLAEKAGFDSLQATIDIPRFRDSVGRLERVYNQYISSRYAGADSVQKRLATYRDSLFSTNEKLFKAKEDLLKLDNGTDDMDEVYEDISEAADKLRIEKELATDGVTKFHFSWITGGLKYRRDTYSTYDSSLLFSTRIGEKNFDKWTLSGSYNFLWQMTDPYLKWRERRTFISSFYIGLTWSLTRGNTFEKIKESDIALISTRAQNDSIYQFSKPGKLKNISGKLYEASWVHAPAITLTPMFGKSNFFGLNLRFSGEFGESAPVFNFRSGLLFRFKDSENEKSKVNFELFLNFADMSDTQDTGKSVWQNKQVGVSATVPFEKVFFR